MNFLSMFTDDQLAIGGCLLALTGCGLIAALSYQFGPAGRRSNEEPASPSLKPVSGAGDARPAVTRDRRAA